MQPEGRTHQARGQEERKTTELRNRKKNICLESATKAGHVQNIRGKEKKGERGREERKVKSKRAGRTAEAGAMQGDENRAVSPSFASAETQQVAADQMAQVHGEMLHSGQAVGPSSVGDGPHVR